MASEAVVRQDGAYVEVVVGFFDGEGHSPEGQKEQDGAGHEHVLERGGGWHGFVCRLESATRFR